MGWLSRVISKAKSYASTARSTYSTSRSSGSTRRASARRAVRNVGRSYARSGSPIVRRIQRSKTAKVIRSIGTRARITPKVDRPIVPPGRHLAPSKSVIARERISKMPIVGSIISTIEKSKQHRPTGIGGGMIVGASAILTKQPSQVFPSTDWRSPSYGKLTPEQKAYNMAIEANLTRSAGRGRDGLPLPTADKPLGGRIMNQEEAMRGTTFGAGMFAKVPTSTLPPPTKKGYWQGTQTFQEQRKEIGFWGALGERQKAWGATYIPSSSKISDKGGEFRQAHPTLGAGVYGGYSTFADTVTKPFTKKQQVFVGSVATGAFGTVREKPWQLVGEVGIGLATGGTLGVGQRIYQAKKAATIARIGERAWKGTKLAKAAKVAKYGDKIILAGMVGLTGYEYGKIEGDTPEQLARRRGEFVGGVATHLGAFTVGMGVGAKVVSPRRITVKPTRAEVKQTKIDKTIGELRELDMKITRMERGVGNQKGLTRLRSRKTKLEKKIDKSVGVTGDMPPLPERIPSIRKSRRIVSDAKLPQHPVDVASGKFPTDSRRIPTLSPKEPTPGTKHVARDDVVADWTPPKDALHKPATKTKVERVLEGDIRRGMRRDKLRESITKQKSADYAKTLANLEKQIAYIEKTGAGKYKLSELQSTAANLRGRLNIVESVTVSPTKKIMPEQFFERTTKGGLDYKPISVKTARTTTKDVYRRAGKGGGGTGGREVEIEMEIVKPETLRPQKVKKESLHERLAKEGQKARPEREKQRVKVKERVKERLRSEKERERVRIRPEREIVVEREIVTEKERLRSEKERERVRIRPEREIVVEREIVTEKERLRPEKEREIERVVEREVEREIVLEKERERVRIRPEREIVVEREKIKVPPPGILIPPLVFGSKRGGARKTRKTQAVEHKTRLDTVATFEEFMQSTIGGKRGKTLKAPKGVPKGLDTFDPMLMSPNTQKKTKPKSTKKTKPKTKKKTTKKRGKK